VGDVFILASLSFTVLGFAVAWGKNPASVTRPANRPGDGYYR